MSAYVPPSHLGRWIRTDLGVRTFQGLGKNAPLREQVVRRLTKDAHTYQILESLPCDIHLQVPLHRRCLPGCGPQTLSPSLSSPSLSLLLRGSPFSQFSADDVSEKSTFGTQTLLAMQKFLDEVESRSQQESSQQEMSCSQMTKKDTNEENAEGKEEDLVEDEHRQTEVEKRVIRAFRTLLHGCEEQWRYST